MQENNGLQITSEVALAAMQKLNDAGIEIPFPQRDLHVRSIDPVAASVLPTSEPDKRTPDVESAFDALAPEARRSRVTGD
jgi:small-conductance mechanosensitive channel